MPQLSESELLEIKEAVARAERFTSGEIVPYIAGASDDYDVAVWRGAFIMGVAAIVISLLVFWFYHGWGLAWLFQGWGAALLTLVFELVGAALAAFVPPVKRLLAGKEQMARTVHRAAMEAFVEEEVFDTRERTGILIYISLFERRIEVIGDAGINRRVTPDDWAGVVTRIRQGIRRGKIAEGIVEALGMCGTLLEHTGVAVRSDDINELPDDIRVRKRAE